MPLEIDAFNQLIKITSPDTSVDLQTLHDFVEDYMASPVGMANDSIDTSFRGDILKPEGKIEDPTNPGVFSIIILLLNSQWQIQFWAGSGYTRVFGGKIVGGVNDEQIKATGTAGDITVLESPVDGTTVAVGSGLDTNQDTRLTELHQSAFNKRTWDKVGKTLIIYDTDGITPLHVFDTNDDLSQITPQ